MPKFNKPDSPNIIWGVNALDADLTRPDDSYIQTGWTQVKPPYEYENYSMNKLYQGFAYYNQLGLPEWDSVTEYQAGKSYVQGSNNKIYKCIQTHANRNPATSGNETWWELFEGNRQATTTFRGTTRYATNTQATNALLDNVALTPSNLLGGVFGSSLLNSNDGSIEIPVNDNGVKRKVIVQWGLRFNLNSGDSISYGKPFPNAVLHIQITDRATDASVVHPMSVDDQSLSRTGFKVYIRTTDSSQEGTTVNTGMFFLAIGY